MSDSHDGHPHHEGMDTSDGLSFYGRRAQAIEALLVEKGMCTTEDVQSAMDNVETRSPADGARVVAHAWADAGFKARLLADPGSALTELGYTLPDTTPHLAVVENTEQVHYMVVCTLCSCYPGALLGPPPDWYKSLAYRSRVVIEPRAVLREFGLELESDIGVRVIDSTAEIRYLVLPRRPAGTEGMAEEQLAELVTRNSMIGVGLPLSPELVTT